MDNIQNNQAQTVEAPKAPAQTSPNSAKDAIKAYLDARAVNDPLFAASYAKPNKNIDECFNYILNEARKRGSSVCMTDDEVFGLAVHYYDEDDIKVGPAPANFRASTTRKSAPAVELTEEEKIEYQKQLLMQLQIMQSNFDTGKKKKLSGGQEPCT